LNGTTNPALQVDASTALQATGLKVTGFAAAGGVGLSAISSGANEPIAINAKGSSAIGIGNVSTGGVQLAAGGGGVTINGNLTFSPTTAGPLGTTTNDNASTGVVGEYVESVIASGSAVALTTATPKTVTSITLSAGDWDIDTLAYFANGATTSFTLISGSISGTTNVLDSTAGKINTLVMNPTIFGGVACSVVIAPYRLSLSGSTTVFLVVQASFTVSTASGFGIIRARRAR
jgi:hypothetical protein